MKLKMKPLAQACALSLLAGSVIAATPAGTTISNQVTATYEDAHGNALTSESNIIDISIREVHAVDLDGDVSKQVSSTAAPIETVHTLTNNGNIAATYSLTATNDAAGDTIDANSVKIYHDADGNGTLNGTEENTEITSFDLAMGASAKFIVVSTLPSSVSDTDTLNVTLTATDTADGAVTDSNAISLTFTDGTLPTTPIKVWNQADGGNCHAYTIIDAGAAIGWNAANTAAEQLVYGGKRGHLVTILNQEEQNFHRTLLGGNDFNYWLGLYRTGGGPTDFAWVTDEPTNYYNWSHGNPDNHMNGESSVHVAQGLNGQWNDAVEDGWNSIAHYIVEFDTPCAQPKVEVALTAAKDVTCDGTADGAFGKANLAGMASGECAIMRTQATNNGTVTATDLRMNYVVPANLSYMPNTLKFDNASQTDATGDDAAAIDNGTIQFIGGDVAVGATSPTGEFQVKVQ